MEVKAILRHNYLIYKEEARSNKGNLPTLPLTGWIKTQIQSSKIVIREKRKIVFLSPFSHPRFSAFLAHILPYPNRDSYALFNASFLPLQRL
jgi:hypothetical protein